MRQPFTERRHAPRPDVALRRRHGLLRPIAHGPTFLPFPLHEYLERRHAHSDHFDIASVLELHLDRFPTREGMLVLLRSWLYVGEGNGLASAGYTAAVRRAIDVMEQSASSVEAIELLHGRAQMTLVRAL